MTGSGPSPLRRRLARGLAAGSARTMMPVPALLTGCASVGNPPRTPHLDALPERVELRTVPFHAQADHQCGPAALAMALNYAGVDTTPEALVPWVYVPGRAGSLQVDMLAAARRHGCLAFPLDGEPDALQRELAAGHPVIVLLNLSLPVVPQWHYAVAIGYDRPGQSIVLRSGPNRREALGALTFDHLWARSGRWGMLALPPGRLPATATAGSYLAAATALERVSPEAAASAYDTAVTAWPGHRLGWLGRGNARASAGDARGAERAFRQALARFPDDADAWNNLATTLAELGRTAQAREAVSRAIELGGPREARYRQTRAQLETAAGR